MKWLTETYIRVLILIQKLIHSCLNSILIIYYSKLNLWWRDLENLTLFIQLSDQWYLLHADSLLLKDFEKFFNIQHLSWNLNVSDKHHYTSVIIKIVNQSSVQLIQQHKQLNAVNMMQKLFSEFCFQLQ